MVYGKDILKNLKNFYEIKNNKIVLKDIFQLPVFDNIKDNIKLIEYLFHSRIEDNNIKLSPSILFNQNILNLFIISGNIDMIYDIFYIFL